jgi:hypothetical protein
LRACLLAGSKAADCCCVRSSEFLGGNTTGRPCSELAEKIGFEDGGSSALFRIEKCDLKLRSVLRSCVSLETDRTERLRSRRKDVQHHLIGLAALARNIDCFIQSEFPESGGNSIQCQVHREDPGYFCFGEIEDRHRGTRFMLSP